MNAGFPTFRSKGLTLLEILVVVILFLLAGTLLFQVFSPSIQALTRGANRMELHQSAWLVMDRLSADLGQAAPGGWSFLSDSDQAILSVHKLDGLTAQGDRAWEDILRITKWRAAERTIQYFEWPPGPPDLGVDIPLDSPLALTPDQLAQFSTASPPRQRLLVDDVELLEIAQVAPPATQPLRVRLVLKRQEAGPRESQQFELEREFISWNN